MPKDLITPDPWQALRAMTPARVGMGRAGQSLPTRELLAFGLAHAQARDAVHLPLDAPELCRQLQALGLSTRVVCSAAPDRAAYLLRPDLGRRLAPAAQADLQTAAQNAPSPTELLVVIADGLSSAAVMRQAPPLLSELQRLWPPGWRWAPVIVATQARVALGDPIGQILGAPLVVVLIGERPGLSSPDSLGAYLTYAPRVGCHDAQRNCLSNIRPEGLSHAEAARKLLWLAREAHVHRLTGVALKDLSDLKLLPQDAAATGLPST